MVEISEIITDSDFLKLRDDWNRLLNQSNNDTIFITWEWLYTWWKTFGQTGSRQLFIIIVREKGELVGIAPFIKRQIKAFGIVNRTRLELLGTGEDEKDEVCSNYMDFIVIPGMEETFAKEVVSVLSSFEHSFDEIVLNSVSENSHTIKYFVELLKGCSMRFKHNVLNISPCLFINLPSDWEAYLKTLGDKTRRNVRRDRKILAEKGPLEYSTYCDKESYKYFDAVIELHKKRWQENEKQDMFSSKTFLDFHAKVSELFAEKGWLKIGILTSNGQRIAASYHFIYKKTLFAYQVGCDDGYDRRLSVGMAEFGYSIEEAIKAKCKEYDFYKASRKGYKALLAKDSRNVIDVRIARDDLVEKFISTMKKIKTLIGYTCDK